MKISDNLGNQLDFEHHPETRSLSGPDAERVHQMLVGWSGEGTLYGTQGAPAPDPLGSRADMAVFLFTRGFGYTLPPELAALLPPAEPIPDDAVA